MGTTAQKLTHLNETKSQLKDTINYTGASITDDTFRQYPRKLYTQYLDILKEPDTLFNNMPKVEQTGTELSLNNTANTRMKLELNPSELIQETTTGKNILRYTLTTLKNVNTTGIWNNNVYSLNGLTFTVNDDLTIKVNGTATGGSYTRFGLFSSPIQFTGGTNYFMSGCPSGGSASTYMLKLNVTGENDTGSGKGLNRASDWSSGIFIQAETGTQCNNLLFKPQIELGTSATSYEMPIGVTPNPDYPQEVQVIKGNNSIKIENKNLFTSELTYGRAWNNSNGTGDVWSGQYARTSDFIKVKPNTTYTISFVSKDNSKSGNILSYTSSQSFINSVGLDTNLTFTTSSTTYYVKFNFYNGSGYTTGDIYNLQLENNNSATTYVAHQEQVLPLNLPVENLIPTNANAWAQGTISSSNGLNSDSTTRVRTIDYYNIVPGNYSLSIQNSTYCWLNMLYYDSNKDYITSQAGIASIDGLQNAQITVPNGTKYFRATIKINNSTTILPSDINLAKPQVEKGDKVNIFTPHGTTPIEYCKIGDYADEFEHIGDKWYINKAIGKVVLDGSQDFQYSSSYNAIVYANNLIANVGANETTIKCDKVLGITINQLTNTNGIAQNVNFNRFLIKFEGVSNYNTNELIKQYFSNNNFTVYYVLATPTHEEITDTTLISQLNAIEQAVSYDEQTNISQTNTQLPFRIKATAIKRTESVFV